MTQTTAPAAHTSYSCRAMLAQHALDVHLQNIARQRELAVERPRRAAAHLANAEVRETYTWQHEAAVAEATCTC